jgi:hypothetical protein
VQREGLARDLDACTAETIDGELVIEAPDRYVVDRLTDLHHVAEFGRQVVPGLTVRVVVGTRGGARAAAGGAA